MLSKAEDEFYPLVLRNIGRSIQMVMEKTPTNRLDDIENMQVEITKILSDRLDKAEVKIRLLEDLLRLGDVN